MTSEVGTLLFSLNETATALSDLQPDALMQARLDELKAEENIVVLEVFTATGTERIRCTVNGLQRGTGGTEAMEWPAGSCVEIVDVIACTIVEEDEDEDNPDDEGGSETGGDDTSGLGFELGKGLVYKGGKLQLDTTGVFAGDHPSGISTNECGQVTNISEKFPLRLDQDPCCKKCGAELTEE